MLLRLLKLSACHPLAALAVVGGAPIVGLALGAAALAPRVVASHASVAGLEALDSPRAILGRVWFDRYPEKATDESQVWIWLAGGIGLHQTGSFWRSTLDIFDFERQGDKLSMVYLQDKKAVETRFKVTACDERPPFDACLDVTTALGGRTRYYGWASEEDAATHVPWSKAVLRTAEARAQGSR